MLSEPQDFLSLSYQHFTQFFCDHFPKNSPDIIRSEQSIRWFSGSAMSIYNCAFIGPDIGDDWEQVIESHATYFKKKKCPHAFFVAEGPRREDIVAALAARNLGYFGPYTFVCLDMDNEFEDSETSFNVSVKRVEDGDDLKVWVEILARVFFPQKCYYSKAIEYFYDSYLASGLTQEGPFDHYTGYLNGQAVGIASILRTVDRDGNMVLGGLWNGGVLPEARCHGVGRAMALKRLERARELGIPKLISILRSEGMAWSYCRPLGFKKTVSIYPLFAE